MYHCISKSGKSAIPFHGSPGLIRLSKINARDRLKLKLVLATGKVPSISGYFLQLYYAGNNISELALSCMAPRISNASNHKTLKVAWLLVEHPVRVTAAFSSLPFLARVGIASTSFLYLEAWLLFSFRQVVKHLKLSSHLKPSSTSSRQAPAQDIIKFFHSFPKAQAIKLLPSHPQDTSNTSNLASNGRPAYRPSEREQNPKQNKYKGNAAAGGRKVKEEDREERGSDEGGEHDEGQQ
ncbi:hypothetical protein C8J57DRAFT_1228701 [Mycena rebaudengoi]|nr:hypothetical protein C8J57DRAFT_1228701 [Mycena rebaudengoi]